MRISTNLITLQKQQEELLSNIFRKIINLFCRFFWLDFAANSKRKQNIGQDKMPSRDRPRFLNQVGHQTTNASMGNKHFFTK